MTGSESADDYEAFFRRVFPRAVGVALRISGNRPSAEDAALEALAKAHFRWRKIGGAPWREAWVMRVTVNEAIRHLPRAGPPAPATHPPSPACALLAGLWPWFGGAVQADDRQPSLKGITMGLDLCALETSFDLIAPRGDELMDEFYARLFEAAPAVQPLFAGTDLRRQKTMLLGTLVLLRKSLDNLDAIVPNLRQLGARHVAYGAQPEHYAVVGQTLIAAMATVAGSDWSSEFERAWRDAFGIVADVMLEGAAAAGLEQAA